MHGFQGHISLLSIGNLEIKIHLQKGLMGHLYSHLRKWRKLHVLSAKRTWLGKEDLVGFIEGFYDRERYVNK